MDSGVRPFGRLDPHLAAAVLRAAAHCSQHDGAAPLSEAAELAVRRDSGHTTHLLVQPAQEVVGYAQLRRQDAQVEGFVLPSAREAGWGTALGEAIVAHPGRPARVTAWAHGDLPGAAALARRFGATCDRQLWQMRRPADGDLPALHVPAGVRLRRFEPGRDNEDWLALNAAAFRDHPEQGHWSAADLAHRMGEPWFDPHGFILAQDVVTGELVAAHWTKIEVGPDGVPFGEVYVVAVAPSAQGRGLGRLVTLAGLHYLRQIRPNGQPLGAIQLYTDGDNTAAVALYRRLGFERVAVHSAYMFAGLPDKLGA